MIRKFFVLCLFLFWVIGLAEYVFSANIQENDSAVPSYFILLRDYAILVEKSNQTLYLYDKDYKVLKTFHVTTGQNQGDKRAEGDKKTPEGVYFFTSVKEQKELLPKYGVMALPINYPNFIDTRLRKKGNGIWLHATDDPTRPIKPFDSKGCVVAANEDILELADHIKLQTTPMVIVESIEWNAVENNINIRQDIDRFLEKWRSSWEKKDIDSYMDSYSKSFKANGLDRKKWREYKNSLNRQYMHISVSLSDINVLRHNSHIVVSFVQHYKNERLISLGIKRLYLAFEDDKWKILGEEWESLPTQQPAVIAKKYASYRIAKIDAQPKQDSAQNTASLQNVGSEANGNSSVQSIPSNGATIAPQTPTNDVKKEFTPSSKLSLVDIEDFTIDKEQTASRIRFKLINKAMERQKISGRLTIVAANKTGNDIVYTSYPQMTLEQGAPKDFRSGEWFSIRRFKVVSGEFEEKAIDHVAVLVYSKTGELLLYKKFPMPIKQ